MHAPLLLAATADTPSAAGDLTARAQQADLASRPQWLRLLHFERLNDYRASLIKTESFFLASNGRQSPIAELNATIEAWFQPVADNPDEHPRCRFPARYQWLSGQLGPPAELREIHCPRLERWARFNRLDSISLMMVSGYFGNPASTFGHILMKLNNGEIRTRHSLLDMGINYGALIPENELTLVYIYRGLTGGYDAGFSDQNFYRHDLTYSRTEFRDMWEYELALDESQRRLIVNHLWEISGKKFTYYFLRENCAYRLAELLELATGEDFVSDVSLWYAPVSVFHRMREIDARAPGSLIRSVRFIPSSQRQLHAEFERLNPRDKAKFNEFVTADPASVKDRLDDPGPPASTNLLGALLSYYEYRLAAFAEDERPSDLVGARNDVLSYRLRLPPGPAEPVQIPPLRPPSAGSAPSRAVMAFGWNNTHGSQIRIGYSAFNYDAIGNNNLGGSSLAAFDLNLLVDDQGSVHLDHLDFIRARKLNLHSIGIAGESRRSWEVGLGLRRADLHCLGCTELFAEGAIGLARRFGSQVTGYGMTKVILGSRERNLELAPGLGLVAGAGTAFRAELFSEYAYSPDESDGYWRARASARYSLRQNLEIRLRLARDRETEAGLGVALHW